MSRYVPKRILTKSTTPRKSKWTRVLVSGGVILALVSFSSPIGHEQASAPTVSPTSPSMVVSQEPIKIDWQSTIEATRQAEYWASVNSYRPEPTYEVVAKYSSYEITLTAKAVWGEARGCSRDEQKLVVWCICNRADARDQSVEEVVTAPYQFAGYDPDHPVEPEIVEVVEEVFQAWARGEEALVLPPYATTSNYQFIGGDGKHNWFREEY